MLYSIIIRRGPRSIESLFLFRRGSLPDRSASNSLSLSLRGASALAPTLQRFTEAVKVVAAFVYAYMIAGVVV
jgi:hypothetical protein